MRHTPNRMDRRSAKGQAMAIFALVSVLLFVVSGLAVDAGTSYLTSNGIERAAASAALAGVAYLPGDYADAQNAALVEAARDGYTNAGSGNACPGNASPCVVTAQPTTNELKVTISVSVGTIFLRLLGFGSHTVVRSDTAEYLPPISLGQPGSQQGSDMDTSCDGTNPPGQYCANPSSGLGSSGSYYFERTEGWGNPRSEGDPFNPSPNQGGTCGPNGSGDSCNASSAPDYHLISPEAQTEASISSLNYPGGSNYLITIPPGDSADVQIYNPSFAPDTCTDSTTSVYCYHEDDGSFEGTGAPATDYSAMEYTIFQVSTLSSRLSDTKIGQEVFYPYNATNLASTDGSCPGATPYSYFYFNPPTSGSATQTKVCVKTSTFPATYHNWVSALNYTPSSNNDKTLYNGANKLGAYLSNSGTQNVYFRLEVDTLTFNGQVTCANSSCATPSTGTDTASEAHKGYAVRLVSDAGGPTPVQGTVPGSQCNSACGTISAMDDMVVYTPVNGATATQFSIPLFSVDPSYAGQTINVDLFDIGDVGGGAAYVGLQSPTGAWVNATSMTDMGASLNGATTPANPTVPTLGTWPTGGSCGACFQTAYSGGGAIYGGEWVQIQVQVPQGITNGYWDLVYNVNANATAGDTFGVEVGFNGTPDHLLP